MKLLTPEEIRKKIEQVKRLLESIDQRKIKREKVLQECKQRLDELNKKLSQSLEDAPEIDSNENGDEGSSNQ